MLEESLKSPKGRSTPTEPAIVIWFNPWHYRDVEQLVRMFFDELATGLSLGIQLRNPIRRGFAHVVTPIARMLPWVGSLVGSPAVVTNVASKELLRYGDQLARELPLGTLKTKLSRQLARVSRPIVVFVDDIDRLEADATKLLFRMVRLNANFPNVVYVLAFDRHHVERCLDSDTHTFARDYLEKIIQVAVDIPPPESITLRKIFDNVLDDCLASIQTRPLNAERYRTVLDASFDVHFRTIRTVKRYANCLRLTLPSIAMEVDLVDFLGIEMVRMFHPEIYVKMADARELLAADAIMPELLLEDNREQMRAELQQNWFDELTETLDRATRAALKKLLQVLFPGFASSHVTAEGEGNVEAYRRRHGRVCSIDVFDKFFRLAVPSGRVSQAEVDAFGAKLASHETAARRLREAERGGNIRDLLRRIGDVLPEMSEERAANLAVAVLADTEWDRHDYGLTARWMVRACLRRQEAARSRRNLMERIAKSGGTLLTVVEVLDTDDDDDEGMGPEDAAMVREIVMRRLEAAANDGSLWADERWYYMLSTWDRWGEREQVRKAVMDRARTDDGLIQFLEGERSAQASEVVGRRIRRLDVTALERWIDVAWVEQRLETMVAKGGGNARKAGELLALFNDDG